MPEETRSGRAVDTPHVILEEKIAQLQEMKSFQDELVRIVRTYTSDESFTS